MRGGEKGRSEPLDELVALRQRVTQLEQDRTTALIATNEALRQSEGRYQALTAACPIGIFQNDPAGNCTYVNRRWLEITGRREEDSLGDNWTKSIVPEEREAVLAEWKACAREGREFSREFQLVGQDGSIRWVHSRTAPVYQEDGTLFGHVGTTEDITERKRAEERQIELETFRAKEMAEEANRVKDEFLATMSHELRTPLNVIMGYVDLMIEDAFGPLSTEQKQTLHRVRVSADELFLLISALLDLSRLEAGRLPIEKQEIAPATFIEQLRIETEGVQDLSHLEFVWQVDLGFRSISTDPNKLKTIVKNLIGNAIKFTESGQITVTARWVHEGIEIAVTDTGIGIPIEAQRLIFEPFRQIDGSTTRQHNGTGLGLHIVKRLLDALGGTVGVDSAVGRGSTFRVWLPYEQARPTSDTVSP